MINNFENMSRQEMLEVLEAHASAIHEKCHIIREGNFTDLNNLATLKNVLGDTIEIFKKIEENIL